MPRHYRQWNDGTGTLTLRCPGLAAVVRCLTAANGESNTAGTRQTGISSFLKRRDVSVLVAARTSTWLPPPVTHPGQPPHPNPLPSGYHRR